MDIKEFRERMERWKDKDFLDGLTPEMLRECMEGYLRKELGLKRYFGPVYRRLRSFKGNIEGKRFTKWFFNPRRTRNLVIG